MRQALSPLSAMPERRMVNVESTLTRENREKTLITELAIAKISSRMLSGDFGVRVVCASEHHFFLDITF
jgi:hypothetical protein